METLSSLLKRKQLKINDKKTKIMVVSKKENNNVCTNVKLGNKRIKQVKQFCYLGSLITENNRSTNEIKRRIAPAKQAFNSKRGLLTNKHINVDIRKKFVETYVWSVLMYGCETWQLGKQDVKRLEAIEMWLWRRMQKVSWIERKNE